MAVKKKGTRKAVTFTFKVEGREAIISAARVDPETGEEGEVFERKVVPNHPNAKGESIAFVTYPEGYEGETYIVVQGSKYNSKSDCGTIKA